MADILSGRTRAIEAERHQNDIDLGRAAGKHARKSNPVDELKKRFHDVHCRPMRPSAVSLFATECFRKRATCPIKMSADMSARSPTLMLSVPQPFFFWRPQGMLQRVLGP